MLRHSELTVMNSSIVDVISTLEEEDNYEFTKIGIPIFIYLLIVCIVGTIGNIHVLLVYSLKYKSSIYKIFVLCLASVDLIGCVFCIPAVLYILTHPNSIDDSGFCKGSKAFDYFVGPCSLMLLDVIAIERYRKICHATKSQFTIRTAKYACAGVIIFVLCLSVFPVTVIYGINPMTTRYHGLRGYDCTVLTMYNTSLFSQIYRGAIFFLFLILLLICVIMYALIRRKIYLHQKQQSSHNENQRRDSSDNTLDTRNSLETETSVTNDISLEPANEERSPNIKTKLENDHKGAEYEIDQEGNGRVNLAFDDSPPAEDTSKLTLPDITIDVQNTTQLRESVRELSDLVDTKSTLETSDGKYIKEGNGTIDTQENNNRTNNTVHFNDTMSTHKANKKVHKYSQRNKKLKRSRNITTLFMVVSIVSFGVYLPYLIFTILRNVDRKVYEMFVEYNPSLDLFISWMFYLNNGINPLIYGFMDANFRQECLKVYIQIKNCLCSFGRR